MERGSVRTFTPMTDMTGVLPTYRGKGVATLLKLSGIRYAQAHGNYELRVTNDSVNTAMVLVTKTFCPKLPKGMASALMKWPR